MNRFPKIDIYFINYNSTKKLKKKMKTQKKEHYDYLYKSTQ